MLTLTCGRPVGGTVLPMPLPMRSAARLQSTREVKTLYGELRAVRDIDIGIDVDADSDPDTEPTYQELLQVALEAASTTCGGTG